MDWDELLAKGEEQADEVFEEADTLAADHNDAITTDSIVGKPAKAIVAYAEEHDVDHIMIGSHGRKGVSRVLLGSVAERVARRSPVPVTIVPAGE
ncbi:MAG: universal stress protein [Natrialbaceae archaeon]|nr:universal stress protein [Natrialbaceae archaeon]